MKTLLRTFLLVASTLLTANVLSAAVVTLTSGGSYTVPGGQVAKIVTVLSDNGTVDMTVDGLAVSVPTATPPPAMCRSCPFTSLQVRKSSSRARRTSSP